MKTATIWTIFFVPTQSIIISYSNAVDADIFLSKQVDHFNYKVVANKLTYTKSDLTK